MAGKISYKTTVYALMLLCSYALVPIIMSACMNPVDIDKFVKDERVDEIVNVNKGNVVYLSKDSDNGLVGGNGKVKGLNPNRYYMVTKELNETGTPVIPPSLPYPWFVTEFAGLTPGQLIDNLKYITRISGGKITTLTNFHTYTVKSATTFSNTTTFSCSGGTSSIATVDNSGKMTITSTGGGASLTGLDANYSGYRVMAVAVNPSTLSSAWTNFIDISATPLQLETRASTVDYVFYKPSTQDFKVLRVEIKTEDTVITNKTINGVIAPVTGATPVTSIDDTQYTGTVTWSPAVSPGGTFAASTTYSATVTLTAKSGFTLNGLAAGSLSVSGASTVITPNAANSGVIVVGFPATAANPTGNVNITITFDTNDGNIVRTGTAPDPFSYNDILTGGKTLIFTFNTAGATFTDAKWYLGDDDTTPIGTGNSITINSSSTFINRFVTGKQTIIVHAKRDGVSYSNTINFDVNN